MIHLDAAQLQGRLPRRALIDALDAAFRSDTEVSPRQHHVLGGAAPGGPVLLTMPAWRRLAGGTLGALGVKLVTVFPDNASRGLGAVHATYTLFDGATGVPRATLDGAELTHRRDRKSVV